MDNFLVARIRLGKKSLYQGITLVQTSKVRSKVEAPLVSRNILQSMISNNKTKAVEGLDLVQYNNRGFKLSLHGPLSENQISVFQLLCINRKPNFLLCKHHSTLVGPIL